jgi:hypothetical protein
VLYPLVRGMGVCYLSCIVTDTVLILWWLLCFTVSVTSTEDGNRYCPKRRMVLCVVTMQQTVTYSLNDTNYVKPCQKSTQFTKTLSSLLLGVGILGAVSTHSPD